MLGKAGAERPLSLSPKPINHDFVISTEGRNLFTKTLEKLQKPERKGVFFDKS